MLQDDYNFKEEFSNWVKTVFGLRNARDGSIEYIKRTLEDFVKELLDMHISNREEHFKDILMKIAVNGKVNKSKSGWALEGTNCIHCVEVFHKVLDKFKKSRCYCKKWIETSLEEQITSSPYWWVLAKVYIAKPEIRDAEEPSEVDPLAIFNCMKNCKLFDGECNVVVEVKKLVDIRHKLMHSPTNRLSNTVMGTYFKVIKNFLRLVVVHSDETINEVEKIETSIVVAFEKNGELSKQAKEALQLQNRSLNTDFKSPEGICCSIKSLAASSIESKVQESKWLEREKTLKEQNEELLKQKEIQESKWFEREQILKRQNGELLKQKEEVERRFQESENEAKQNKIDLLEHRLSEENGKLKTFEENLKEITQNMQKQITDIIKSSNEQGGEISSLQSRVEEHATQMTQERNKRHEEISSLESTMQKQITDIIKDINKQSDEISSLQSTVDEQATEMTQERNKRHREISSLESTPTTQHVYQVQPYKEFDVEVGSGEDVCCIVSMCQMSDGTVVITDSSNYKLKTLDDKLNVKDFYRFDYQPLRVVPVSSSEVAVLMHTNENTTRLEFIQVKSSLVHQRTISLGGILGSQLGMIYCNDQIWIHSGNSVHIYELSGSLVKSIKKESWNTIYLQHPLHCSLSLNNDKKRVYVMNGKNVDVLNTDGEELLNFSLNNAQYSSTTTLDDIILIAGNDNIVMYDMEGKHLGELVARRDLLSRPLSLLYDGKKRCLIVGFTSESKIREYQLVR